MMTTLDHIKRFNDNIIEKDPSFSGILFCKLSGVTYDGRQENLEKVTSDTQLKLERDRTNDFDFYATKVAGFIDNTWKDLGFIPKKLNKQVAHALDEGVSLRAKVYRLVGGGDMFFGLSVTIEESKQ